MFAKTRKTCLMVIAVLTMAGLAHGGDIILPDPDMSTATRAYTGPEILTVMIVPNGAGGSFPTAKTPTGEIADGTITLYLLDSIGFPVPNYPREDIWLQSGDSTLFVCANYYGSHPDGNTDAEGYARWVLGLHGGGYSEGPILVYINGMQVSSAYLPLAFNSPDIDGNGIVGLNDLTLLAEDLYGTYHFRSDLHRDGVVNLSDIVPMALNYGATCQ
jgi:hypothetical protein